MIKTFVACFYYMHCLMFVLFLFFYSVLTHRDQHGLFILGSLEEIFTLLEDNQVSSHPCAYFQIFIGKRCTGLG